MRCVCKDAITVPYAAYKINICACRSRDQAGAALVLIVAIANVQVRAGEYECIYMNMHPFGLGGVVATAPIQGRYTTARGRMGETKGDDHPVVERESNL